MYFQQAEFAQVQSETIKDAKQHVTCGRVSQKPGYSFPIFFFNTSYLCSYFNPILYEIVLQNPCESLHEVRSIWKEAVGIQQEIIDAKKNGQSGGSFVNFFVQQTAIILSYYIESIKVPYDNKNMESLEDVKECYIKIVENLSTTNHYTNVNDASDFKLKNVLSKMYTDVLRVFYFEFECLHIFP